MPFIEPTTLYHQLRKALLTCSLFETDSTLRAIFVDDRIQIWQNQLKEAETIEARVNQTLALLWDKQHADYQENGLILFLHVLADYIPPADALHHELKALTTALIQAQAVLIETQTEPPLPVEKRLPALSLASPFGTLPPDSPFYIRRQADEQCWQLLNNPHGKTVVIQAPRQMGKSSLMQAMINQAEQTLQKPTLFLDMQLMPQQYLQDEAQFMKTFCRFIARAMQLPTGVVNEMWDDDNTSALNCSDFIRDWVLRQMTQPFILAIDELERLLTSNFQNNFFGLLRSWHNNRAYDKRFARLTFLLISSTEPGLFIDNPRQSPFNVAELILLHDFSWSELQVLNQRYHSLLTTEQCQTLFTLTQGHPYLCQLTLYKIAQTKQSFEALLDQATSDDGLFGPHLRRYYLLVLDKPSFTERIRQVIQQKPIRRDRIFYQLKGLGLITETGFRNPLYARYFQERLYE